MLGAKYFGVEFTERIDTSAVIQRTRVSPTCCGATTDCRSEQSRIFDQAASLVRFFSAVAVSFSSPRCRRLNRQSC